jgi:hypothetical protein
VSVCTVLRAARGRSSVNDSAGAPSIVLRVWKVSSRMKLGTIASW